MKKEQGFASSRTASASPRLTREGIAEAALEMADEIGVDAISMRKLAARLDVTAMALYRYYDSIDDIRSAVVACAFAEVDAHAIPGERWDDTLRRTTGSIREMNLRHAAANLASVEMAGDSPAMIEHTRRIYGLHEAQGIPADILRKTWRIIDAFLGGFLTGELADIRSMREHENVLGEAAESWRETARGAYSEETFRDGIDIIIAGVRAMAAPDPCEWRTPSE